MKRDLDESLGDIQGGGVGIKELIWEVQEHLVPRSDAQQWAKRLRFITNGDRPTSEPTHPDSPISVQVPSQDCGLSNSGSEGSVSDNGSTSVCDCVRKMPFAIDPDGHVRGRVLHVTAPGDVLDCNDYVAVSYRWPSRSQAPDKYFKVHTGTDAAPRPNRAPKRVLERAMAFAEFCNCKLIWIDQECIEQDDRQDKEFGIQSMDEVFQNASFSVALLSNGINEQRHLDALFDLVEHREGMSREEVISALEVLEIILGDEWHSRAWCFQEICVSIQHMTFLIPRCPGLSPQQDLAKIWCRVPNEIEMDAADLFASASTIFAYEDIYPDLAARMENVNDLITASLAPSGHRSVSMEPSGLPAEDNQLERYQFNSAQAIHYLDSKRHSRIPDALAILANLCNYSLRLNTMALDTREKQRGSELSLSICIYTLSIANGDLSLLFGAHADKASEVAKSWIPSPTTKFDNIYYHDMSTPVILQGCKIEETGLKVSGILWSVDQRISLHLIRSQFVPKWQSVDPDKTYFSSKAPTRWSADGKALAYMELEILRDVLGQLHSCGQVDLAYTLLDAMRGQETRKSLLVSQADRKQVAEYLEIFRELEWLNLDEEFQNEPEMLWGINREALKWIVRRCLREGFLLAGRPLGSASMSSCLFDVDAPCMVLSPVLSPRSHSSSKLLFAVSWTVERHEEAGRTLEVSGLVRGTWRQRIETNRDAHRFFIIS